jgi:hypothetical protein
MYKSPTIEVTGAELVEVSEEALAFAFTLDMQNPNREPLELIQFDYRLSVDGQSVYSGRRAAGASLSATGEQQVTIPAVVRHDQMGWDGGTVPSELKYALRGSVLYITPGEIAEILLDTGVRRPRAGFGASGVITVESAP